MWIINVAYDRPYTFQEVEGRSAPQARVIDRVVAPRSHWDRLGYRPVPKQKRRLVDNGIVSKPSSQEHSAIERDHSFALADHSGGGGEAANERCLPPTC